MGAPHAGRQRKIRAEIDAARGSGQIDRADREPVGKFRPQERVDRPFQFLEATPAGHDVVMRRERGDEFVLQGTPALQRRARLSTAILPAAAILPSMYSPRAVPP